MTVISSTNGSMEIVEDLPIPEDSTNVHKPKIKITTIEKPKVKIETAPVEKPHKKIHLNIIETTNVNAYKDVAARFRQSHETDDSLFLAKAYYRKGNYKKAEYWALQTNKVNGNIEETWLIFIKSKVKLGHKNEAIRILTEYVKRSNSPQARILLEKMTKGAL
jgi:tetratricopeptide (TPR) repeat protein